MEAVYKKIADASVCLESQMNPKRILLRIGVDGIPVGEFINHAARKRGIGPPGYDDIVQISSNDDDDDVPKLFSILKASYLLPCTIYAVDMRTKTGSLGKKLKDYIETFKDKIPVTDFKYAVLFDKYQKADIRGSLEELGDGERPKWFDGIENKPIKLFRGKWKYPDDTEIEKLNHISQIMRLI